MTVRPDDSWTLFAVMAAAAAGSLALERRYRWAARVTGPVLAIAAAIALATADVIPRAAPAYDVVSDWFVPISIPLLLFRADVRKIFRESGRTFVAFNVAALGTIVGGLIAGLLFAGTISHAGAIAAIMTGSYTGGSVNFVALQSIFRPPAELASAAIVADNLVMALYFFVLLATPSIGWIRRRFAGSGAPAGTAEGAAADYWAPRPIALFDLAVNLAAAVAVAAASVKLAEAARASDFSPGVKAVLGTPYLYLTTFALVLATLFPKALGRRPGAEECGTLLLYFFFFVIGAPASVVSIVRDSPALLGFCAVMLAANYALSLGVGRLLGLPLEDCLVACNATAGGPATAAAMAIGKGWTWLVLPAVLVGVWGYAIGNYLGLLVGRLLGAPIPGN